MLKGSAHWECFHSLHVVLEGAGRAAEHEPGKQSSKQHSFVASAKFLPPDSCPAWVPALAFSQLGLCCGYVSQINSILQNLLLVMAFEHSTQKGSRNGGVKGERRINRKEWLIGWGTEGKTEKKVWGWIINTKNLWKMPHGNTLS